MKTYFRILQVLALVIFLANVAMAVKLEFFGKKKRSKRLKEHEYEIIVDIVNYIFNNFVPEGEPFDDARDWLCENFDYSFDFC